jgi:ABC-type Mn2+/Zn2+ transport system permease subunit
MVVASIIGAVCTTFGLVLSFTLNEVYDKPFPSGPVIILLAAFVYAAALGVRKLVR